MPQAYQALPALFRMLARRKITKVIELLAREMQSQVTREIVIKGYITVKDHFRERRGLECSRPELVLALLTDCDDLS